MPLDLYLSNTQLVDYLYYLWNIAMFLSAIWTLILTAPIHCTGYTDQWLQWCNFSKSVPKSLVWPESEYIFSKSSFLGELFLASQLLKSQITDFRQNSIELINQNSIDIGQNFKINASLELLLTYKRQHNADTCHFIKKNFIEKV